MGSYSDLTSYILGITEEIWEGRDLTSLRRHYGADVLMRFPSGLLRGNQTVIDGTMATLAEFPDRQLLGDDVIWSGSEETGYLSSHRIITNGTHTGHGEFGPPTGRRFEVYVIADCHAKDEVIDDEWLVRDFGGIARQLGFDPSEHARDRIAREGGHNAARRPFHPRDDVAGPYRGTGNDNEWGARLADLLARIMDKDIATIRRDYDRACRVEHWGARGGWSWAWSETDWMRLRASFPSAKFEVHHRIGREDPGRPPRAAVRWSLTGTHDGPGHFGTPTGAEVYVMGITHAEWGPHGLRREYSLIDEVSIWKQIHLHTGAHDAPAAAPA
ncbi:ester cyclase [Jannaschia seohaensis]|uniref:SnoaL-like polyketide cyclase n=1 Tax=Jannaschia seohaensis TaxID=475081 RepID=A0A2Y9A3P6_9RHOB|nr:ester cyclase [Jannaschia seohaensis]PWJ21810.1 SnoaL-like polyketide cyclase [Jannaschia seohaensis]SSA38088.1 SnoaL-like polyketide cyclase [Jannaschia seohaensis]